MGKETAARKSAGTQEEALHRLRRFNFIMGILHFLQGVFMWVVSNDKTYPIFTNYLSFDRASFTLKPNPQLLYQVRFGPAVALFLLASAVAHFYLSTIGYNKYRENLQKGMNPIRPHDKLESLHLWLYCRHRTLDRYLSVFHGCSQLG